MTTHFYGDTAVLQRRSLRHIARSPGRVQPEVLHAIVVIAGAWGAYHLVTSQRDAKAGGLLAQAMVIAEAQVVPVLDWIRSGDLVVDWALRVDALTAVMLVVVTTVSALVHLYSWGYMAEDDSQPRFFAYLSLFTFAMLALVTAADFMQLFFGWEGVGLASYLLIGFWFKKPTANAARSLVVRALYKLYEEMSHEA